MKQSREVVVWPQTLSLTFNSSYAGTQILNNFKEESYCSASVNSLACIKETAKRHVREKQ